MSVYVAFEGIDGLGKSTQISELASSLAQSGRSVRTLREPGALGEQFRELTTAARVADRARMFMFLADRAQLFSEDFWECKRANGGGAAGGAGGAAGGAGGAAGSAGFLLSDRSMISHIAYALNYSPKVLWELNLLATDGIVPDAVVYFEGSCELAAARRASRAHAASVLERDEYLAQVARRYELALELAAGAGARILRVDASKSKEQIREQILQFCLELGA